ncbi:hypothetical protein F3Y22_tig00001728pilonHSYRG00086 [Hibiscus syriacus]|uniref:Reverse transcriptase domain-containing protein n=1 Tax=Hibiscus syriacus TaxID=106335 RepID=A0A6A3CWM7_HIBSY|nr:hypothetical protein F3Y22_tig00001728pilonHSYRG00086 [Hibiscus syriacus]
MKDSNSLGKLEPNMGKWSSVLSLFNASTVHLTSYSTITESAPRVFAIDILCLIVGGDFNVVRFASERIGAAQQNTASNLLEDFISRWQLVDVPVLGNIFNCSIFLEAYRITTRLCLKKGSKGSSLGLLNGSTIGLTIQCCLIVLGRKKERGFKSPDKGGLRKGIETQFFHLSASKRAKLRNWIFRLRDCVASRRYIEMPFSEDEIIKVDVMQFMTDFFWGRIDDLSFNKSFIALIPKKGEVIYPEDFIPYHWWEACTKLCPGFWQKEWLVVFMKCWGRINFPLSRKMGFGKRWRKWIHFCISTLSIAVLVNGCPSNSFSIKRDLRQGCPLSPLLVNVVGEALSGLLKKATAFGLCDGVEIGVGRSEILHIQFADDLLLFSAANERSLKNFNRVLKIFELAAGLKLNIQKSKIYGINVDESNIRFWADSLHCGSASLPTIYLGQPVLDKFGIWENGVWVWRIELRRNLFVWQNSLWSNFLMVLNKAVSSHPTLDRLTWEGSSDGRYTPKSFCSKVATVGKVEDLIWKAVWCKFVPPKISSFV